MLGFKRGTTTVENRASVILAKYQVAFALCILKLTENQNTLECTLIKHLITLFKMYKSFKVLKANYWWFYAEIFALGNVRSFLKE